MTNLAPNSPLTRSRLLVLVLCWLALVADGYDLMAYGATLPGLIGHPPFGLSPNQGGYIGSIALAGMLAGSLVAGTLTDRIGRRWLLIGSLVIFSAGMVVTAFAGEVNIFVASRIVTCVGVGGLLPTGVALASEFASAERRSRTLGAVLTGPPLGMVAAAYAASRLMPAYGFRPVYWIAGIFLLLVPAFLGLLPESPAYLAARGRGSEADLLRAKYGLPAAPEPASAGGRAAVTAVVAPRAIVGTLLVWGATFCSLLTAFGIATWLPQVMKVSGYGLGSSLQFLAVYGLGAVVSTLVASRAADATGPKWLAVAGFACAAAALLAISGRPATPVLYLLVLLAGFGGFGTQNLLNDFIARHYPARVRASGLGWALAVGRLGAIVGPTFGAWAIAMASPLEATATAFGCTAILGALVMSATPRLSRIYGAAVPAAEPARPAEQPAP